MDYTVVEFPETRVMGPTVRTANDAPECTADIGGLWNRFMDGGMHKSVPSAVTEPYASFGLYYDYELATNEYTLLVGCASTAPEVPPSMEARTIPAGRYAKYTVHGDCVAAVAQAWTDIWADEALLAKRAFTVDFEAYAATDDPQDTDIDIYVALK